MPTSVHGVHHVTAIAGDPQENLDFYVAVMGMRMVKKSVNQDVIDTYHLYYADRLGTPGTNLTFFPWPNMGPGRLGVGLTVEVPFVIPSGSLAYWQERLARAGMRCGDVQERFGETTLPFSDPHGLPLALVETDDAREFIAWEKSPVPAERQVRGVHSVRLWERDLAPTEALLTRLMGFTLVGEENGWRRYAVEGGGPGNIVDVKALPGERPGAWGTGSVHHVAWRVKDTDEEMALRAAIAGAGLQPTQQIDRFWFKSVYFREPGGALFELATDGPGFDRDEDREHLGEKLILPPWLESQRSQIEAGLQPLETPPIEE
ncbi:MAG TPA: ring-cleaving dioxygenase [Roseiflexaceae bacterium]